MTAPAAPPPAEAPHWDPASVLDHAELRRLFSSLLTQIEEDDPPATQEAWRTFENALLAHLDAEEAQLFPEFVASHPVDATQLLAEHAHMRKRLEELGLATALHTLRAEDFAEFLEELQHHAAHEDRVLYPWAALTLPEREKRHALLPRTQP